MSGAKTGNAEPADNGLISVFDRGEVQISFSLPKQGRMDTLPCCLVARKARHW